MEKQTLNNRPVVRFTNNLKWSVESYLIDQKSVSINGLDSSINISSKTELQRINGFRRDEWPLLKELLSRLCSEDIFWDVGANMGMYSLFSAQICRTVSIEASPPEVARLQHNVSLNSNLNINIVGAALSDENSVAKFDIEVASINEISDGKLNIPTITGDWLIREGPFHPPSVIKIDVEGAEDRVLYGLKEALSNIRLILLEYHSNSSYGSATSSEIFEYLSNNGCEINEARSASANETHYWARKQDKNE